MKELVSGEYFGYYHDVQISEINSQWAFTFEFNYDFSNFIDFEY